MKDIMASSALDPIEGPSWLLDPPSEPPVSPPVSTRPQILPLHELGWKDFERLCLQLARTEGEAEHWQLYGTEGQKQGGIDIYVRSPGTLKYRVWQVKRYKKITALDIAKAVAVFLKGNWVERSDRFILCTSASIDDTGVAEAIEAEAAILHEKHIAFEVRGDARISEALKPFPAIVDDFFDRAWTERFCGAEAARQLGSRLGRASYAVLRQRLHKLYTSHFATVDPGVLRSTITMAQPPAALPLARRFVAPDFTATEPEQLVPADEPAYEHSVSDEWLNDGLSHRRVRRPRPRRATASRLGLEQWAAQSEQSILFGSPGSGKSTLLRFLTLELLSGEPRLAYLKRRWPGHLPLLLSFPFWTRLIQDGPPGTAISIPSAIARWLEAYSEPELAALALHAFEQRQVLLLVDGVDEWADEESAATALTLLQTFVETRQIPAVVTSRPHGARLLGSLDASWKRQLLAPFNVAQQTEFAEAWYGFLDEQGGRESGSTRSRAEAFVAKLESLPDVAALAGTPLLFSGLMALDREGAILPRNRFQAYRELSDRLIRIHPQARAQAALAARSRPALDPQTRELLLAELAFQIQSHQSRDTGLDAIGKAEAIAHCRDALGRHLDLPPDIARQRAEELLNVGAEALGILVEKSPATIGFLHRAFQELLAAKQIDRLDLDDQCTLMRERADDPQWRDVLLFVTQYASRPTDVDALIQAIEAAPPGPLGSWWRPLLLADIAFGEVQRTPSLTRRLAQYLFGIVEAGPDLDQRAEILKRVVAGLGAEQTAVLVRPKLRSWFPRLHNYNLAAALSVAADWPGIDDILWRNLESDEEECRHVAARALAKRHAGSDEWFARVTAYLRNAPSLVAASAAVMLLDLGWPDRDLTREIVDEAARHDEIGVACAGMGARVRAGRHDDQDRDRLIEWLVEPHDFRWARAASDLLPRGWAHDLKLKALVLKQLPNSRGLYDDIFTVAAVGFAGDPEISRALVSQLKARHPGIDRNFYDLLAEHFAGDEDLANCFAGRPEKAMSEAYNHFHGAKIAATARLRWDLLDDLVDPKGLRFWAVSGLLDHWRGDAEVETALKAVFEWSDDDCARVADQLARIEPDRPDLVEARLRALVAAAAASKTIYLKEIVEGLMAAGLFQKDPSLIDAILDIIASRNPDSISIDSATFLLLGLGPVHPRLEALARQSIRAGDGMIAVVADRFANVPGIRDSIIRTLAPLPLPLRAIIAEGLRDRGADDAWAEELLEEGVRDADGGLAALCEIRSARNRLISQTVDEPYLAHLLAETGALGPSYERRRLTATLSLITIGRLTEAAALLPNLERTGLSMGYWELRGWTDIDSRIAEIWPVLQQLCRERGTDPGSLLGPAEIVERLGPFVEGRPALQSAVREAAQSLLNKQEVDIPVLRYLLQDSANRPDVLERCMPLLANGYSWNDLARSLDAAELISSHFGGNAVVYERIAAAIDAGRFSGPVAALCDGWPDSERLDRIFVELRNNPEAYQKDMARPIMVKILASKSSSQVVLDNLVAMAEDMTGHIWDGIPYWSGTMLRRIKRDTGLQEMLFGHLKSSPSPGTTVSFAGYLAKAVGMTPELARWCTQAIENSAKRPLVESGMDLWLGETVLVQKRLSELLRTNSRL